MDQPHRTRTTRQPAVGRFRRERLARRPDDLAERQQMVITAAERVLEIVSESHSFLNDLEDDRRKWSRDQEAKFRKYKDDRRKLSRELKAELSRNSQDIKTEVTEFLTRRLSRRLQDTARNSADRKKFVDELQKDVREILSSDFSEARQ